MRNKITIDEPDVINNQMIRTSEPGTVPMPGLTEKRTPADIIAAEGSEDFVNYIEWLGFAKDDNTLVLSSMHHYYYDEEEMKNIKTVVNLIGLNQIKEAAGFIASMFQLLPSKSYLIGCFTDYRRKKRFSLSSSPAAGTIKESEDIENGISSGIPFLRTIFNLLDSKINTQLSGKEVTQMLSDRGFRVLDMTELNGKTYFCAQKLLTVVK